MEAAGTVDTDNIESAGTVCPVETNVLAGIIGSEVIGAPENCIEPVGVSADSMEVMEVVSETEIG